MQNSSIFIVIVIMAVVGYFVGYKRSRSIAARVGGIKKLHSLPSYYGALTALWCSIPALIILLAWLLLEPAILERQIIQNLPANYAAQDEAHIQLLANNIRNLAEGKVVTDDSAPMQAAADHYLAYKHKATLSVLVLVLCAIIAGMALVLAKIKPQFRARQGVEIIVKLLLLFSSTIAIVTTLGIVLSVLFESKQFLGCVSIGEFMLGTHWSPQNAHDCSPGVGESFGAIPLFVGTLLISLIALLIAVPIGLMSAIYLSEYASSKFRSFAKPVLEILAGIPTVVYGVFAALTVAPLLRNFGDSVGLTVSSESALATGLVMGVMIIPFMSSLSDDVINAVPQSLRDGSFGLGATKSETIKNVVIPAALPGIVGGVLLAASRAIGETMIVVMAAGLAAKLTINPLEAVTTVTVQIVTLLTGDQEFNSPKTLAAFALGLMLFFTTLLLNMIALRVVRKYREQYD